MSTLTLFSKHHSFVKEALNPRIKLEPWMHIGIIELDNGKLGYVIWIWDSRQVIEEGVLSKDREEKIRLYITDHYLTNDEKINDNYLPLKGGGDIAKAITAYFDQWYDNLVNGIETVMNLTDADIEKKLSDKPKEIELAKRIKTLLGSVSLFEQRCIHLDSFKDGLKIRVNGGHEVAKMVAAKLAKAGLKTDLPRNGRVITVYCE